MQHKIRIRARYADTDQMGVVYYSKYFEYFEMGRTELLRELGLPYSGLEGKGLRLPVLEAHCEYKRGARYDEVIVLKTSLIGSPGVRIRMEYEIFDELENNILARGYTVHSFVNRQGKVARPPKDFVKLTSGSLK